jgi:HEAT repeat protein
MESPQSRALNIFEALRNGRGTAKEAALRTIDRRSEDIDREHLRLLLKSALSKDFVPPLSGQDDDSKASDTRGWLLAALGRVSGDDADALSLIEKYLKSSYEPQQWVRYWALEGLVAGRTASLKSIAASNIDDDPLVKSLITAIRASNGDVECLRKIQKELADRENAVTVWTILRALRIVPLQNPTIIRNLREIVSEGSYSDMTHDSIVALSQIPSTSHQAEEVAQTLADYVTRFRWPMYDSMRTKALIGLGNLKVERTASVLIEELTDGSPSIVYEAARALERVLGVRRSAVRVLEAAAKSGKDDIEKFGSALRWMNRSEVVEELESAMLYGSDAQQETARALLSEIGGLQAFQKLRARTNAVNQYMEALEKAEAGIRELFESSLLEARKGFKTATRMDQSVFALGILLIVTSAVLAIISQSSLNQWAGVGAGLTGGAGVLGVLYGTLIAKPRQQVRQSVDHLMYLKVVFLGYLRQLHQADQAYTRRMIENEPVSSEEVNNFSKMISTIMSDAAHQLAKFNSGP